MKGLRKYITVITIDEFKSLGEDGGLRHGCFNDEFEIKRVIEYLNGMGIENLNNRLLGALAHTYNNDRKFKKAVKSWIVFRGQIEMQFGTIDMDILIPTDDSQTLKNIC